MSPLVCFSVVRDGHITTSRGPGTSLKFALALEDCRSYHSFQKQLGCSAGCTTLSPGNKTDSTFHHEGWAWISRAGSYKIEKCEGEL